MTTFRVSPTPDNKAAVLAFGDDESRVVAIFFEADEAQEYALWRTAKDISETASDDAILERLVADIEAGKRNLNDQ